MNDVSMDKQRYLIKASGVAAALFAGIAENGFSASYFSYALAAFLLFLFYDLYMSRPIDRSFLPDVRSAKWLFTGIVIFYGVLLISAFLHGTKGSVNTVLWQFNLTIPFFLMLFWRARYDIDKGFLCGMAAGALVNCIWAFVQFHSDPNVPAMAGYAQQNHLGTGINLMWPFVLYMMYRTQDTKKKVMWAVLLVLMAGALYTSKTRGAVLALSGGLILTGITLIAALRGKFNLGLIFKGLAVIALVTAVCAGGFLYLSHDKKTGLDPERVGGERLMMLEASWEMWNDHKLTGVGPGKWGEYYYSPKYHPKDGHEKGHTMPHDMPMLFLTEDGIFGVAAYFAFLLLTYGYLYRAIRTSQNKALASAMMLSFLIFTLHGLVDTTIINKIPGRMYYMILGWYAGYIAYESYRQRRLI